MGSRRRMVTRSDHLRRRVVQELEMSAKIREGLRNQANTIVEIAKICARTFERGGKILLCGNGGSAADSQHIAGEFVGRFGMNRRALPALALTADGSILTGIANDYGYADVFSRQLTAFARPGDIILAISVSGESESVIKAVRLAKRMGLVTVALTSSGGRLRLMADYCIQVGSRIVPRVQEAYLTVSHVICGLVEEIMRHGTTNIRRPTRQQDVFQLHQRSEGVQGRS